MMAVMHFFTLLITTLFAAMVAVFLNWLLLHAAFQLMRLATALRTSARAGMLCGTADLARASVLRR
ncbi:MAG TPA: hypothetical protein VOA64_21180 [Candidatus Dormibacteraeota bacterium]|nr:hypothetical protein [Candidatus Dormibacteraeota bacterium]